MLVHLDAAGLTGRHSDHFLRSVNDAIAWADAYADISEPKSSLRRLETEAWWGHLSSPSTRVANLTDVRHRKLKQFENPANTFPKERAQEGRFLVFFPELELFDGMAESESLGFFDVHNTPPHDIWTAWIFDQETNRDDFLLSWVPPSFLELVNDGIDVNFDECIVWLEDLDHPVVPVIRELGLIR